MTKELEYYNTTFKTTDSTIAGQFEEAFNARELIKVTDGKQLWKMLVVAIDDGPTYWTFELQSSGGPRPLPEDVVSLPNIAAQ